MDVSTIVGFIAGFSAMILGFTIEGGHIGALFSVSGAIIVLGGTIGATVFSFPLETLKNVPTLIKIAFTNRVYDFAGLIEEIVRLADQARREGLLSLEQNLEEIGDPFLRQGLQLVIDGVEATLLRDLLETEIYCMEERHRQGISLFESAGGYAPTMGIIGTVMGLVHVLGNISTPEKLAPAIAAAFIATLYGICTANLLWLPISYKLKFKHGKEKLYRELALEGILALQAGENPAFIRQKLLVFLDYKTRLLEEKRREEA